ncbi:hypothetical protein ACQKFG_23310 [Peribacillus sp. NPDC076916]|uniref:hypothetical protein n=1 Tax=Peribacillus sp. NPDC076916 TaxID=3390608 RepID=UPI003D009DB8
MVVKKEKKKPINPKSFRISLWNQRDDCYSDERSAGTVKKQDKIEMSFVGG